MYQCKTSKQNISYFVIKITHVSLKVFEERNCSTDYNTHAVKVSIPQRLINTCSIKFLAIKLLKIRKRSNTIYFEYLLNSQTTKV